MDHKIDVYGVCGGTEPELNVPPGVEAQLRRAALAALAAEGVDVPCALDIIVTDDAGIRETNRANRGVDRPTDVLSFPMFQLSPGEKPQARWADPDSGRVYLGEMMLSLERARAQASEYGHSPEREVCYLAVHSVLHLLGYDHLDEGPMKARMRAREEYILGGLGITRAPEEGGEAPPPPQEQTGGQAMTEKSAIQKSGIITICGRPNVGKSTLTNALVGEKVAIVTHKPQTTRSRIRGVRVRGESQFVFVDTPGLHKARTRLGDYMVSVVRESVSDVDAVVLVVEPVANVGEPEQQLIARIKTLGCPSVLAVNKTDTLPRKEKLLEVIDCYSRAHQFDAVVPLSAKKGQGLDVLLDVLEDFLPLGPQLYPEDMTSDQPERQMMAELLREKLLLALDKEIPHGTAVEITRFAQRDDDVIEVEATIYCEKDSHKGIIVGKGGSMLKKVSTQARLDMEQYMGGKVYLQTWVKVKENWRDNPAAIQNFGYRTD